jgi:hypothetical protein
MICCFATRPRKVHASIIATGWCMVFLLCWTNRASAQLFDDCLKVSKIFTSYNAPRQGTEFDVRITFSASGCALTVPITGGRLQTRLLLKGDSGFQAQLAGMEFSKIDRLSEGPPALYGAHEATLHLRVAAAENVPPGVHHLLLPIAYETADASGRRVTRNTEIEIPVDVAVHDTAVKTQSDVPKWNPLQVLLIPVRLIELLFWDGC